MINKIYIFSLCCLGMCVFLWTEGLCAQEFYEKDVFVEQSGEPVSFDEVKITHDIKELFPDFTQAHMDIVFKRIRQRVKKTAVSELEMSDYQMKWEQLTSADQRELRRKYRRVSLAQIEDRLETYGNNHDRSLDEPSTYLEDRKDLEVIEQIIDTKNLTLPLTEKNQDRADEKENIEKDKKRVTWQRNKRKKITSEKKFGVKSKE